MVLLLLIHACLPSPGTPACLCWFNRFYAGYVLFEAIGGAAEVYTCVTSAILLHDKLLQSVINAPLWFFDSMPLGRILNRCERLTDLLRHQTDDCRRVYSLHPPRVLFPNHIAH
eukprot:GHVU01084759.1.p1 GENE.GHVU01084759.1~~GHVU01084759.1.p1  ORF type:complete len:114 (-),score=10.70 GHVU01084759.1:167-508(-)